MALFGRLLLVANLVLSACFLALAGAVYSTQSTWKDRQQTTQASLTQTETALREAESAKSNAEAELTAKVAAAEADRDTYKGRLDNLTAELAAVKTERDNAEANLERQKALALTQANEAGFRTEAELVQRGVNSQLHDRLEKVSKDLQAVQDDLFSEKLARTQIERQYIAAAEQLENVRRAGGTRNGVIARDVVKPAPEIDGVIADTRKDDAGRVELVQLTIGADDGLSKGQTLDAYRSSDNGTNAKYLGRVELVDVGPDISVARVVQRSKSGIIERGDRVTSRL